MLPLDAHSEYFSTATVCSVLYYVSTTARLSEHVKMHAAVLCTQHSIPISSQCLAPLSIPHATPTSIRQAVVSFNSLPSKKGMDPLVPSNYADDVEPERLQMALERQAAKLRAATDEDVRHSASTTASSTDGIPGSFRVNGPEYSQNMPIDLMDESQDFGSPSPMPPRKLTPPASPEVKAELVDPTDRQKELDRVREDTLEAVRQGAAKAEVVSPERKKRTFICVVAAVTLLNLIIALGVGLGLRRSRVNANHLSRQELVETAVRQETGREFSEEGTSQHEALLWMIHNDTFVEYPLETDEARATFRQRYALCVFAFSTGLEEWKGQEFWLEDVHLCDWSNVACNKDRKITEISLGTFIFSSSTSSSH